MACSTKHGCTLNVKKLRKCMLAGNLLTSLPNEMAQCEELELLRIAGMKLPLFPDLSVYYNHHTTLHHRNRIKTIVGDFYPLPLPNPIISLTLTL